MNTLTFWLRWLAVLPGALLAAILALIPLRLVLYNTLSSFIEPYPETPERLLTPLVVGGVFVYAASKIAPRYKLETAVAVGGLWLFIVGGFVFLTLSGAGFMGQHLTFQGGGFGVLMAVVGAVVAVLYVRKEQHKQSQ